MGDIIEAHAEEIQKKRKYEGLPIRHSGIDPVLPSLMVEDGQEPQLKVGNNIVSHRSNSSIGRAAVLYSAGSGFDSWLELFGKL